MLEIFIENWEQVNLKSKEFVEFCLKNSDCIILTRRHIGGVPEEILCDMAEREIKIIKERRKQQVEYSKTVSKEELEKLFLEDRLSLEKQFILQASMRIQEVKNMVREYKGEKDNLEADLSSFGLIKREYKFGSFFTWPGVWDICSFKKDAIDLSKARRCFFDKDVSIGGYTFSGIGFQNESELVWMKSCLGEREMVMTLSQRQFKDFELLGIPYCKAD